MPGAAAFERCAGSVLLNDAGLDRTDLGFRPAPKPLSQSATKSRRSKCNKSVVVEQPPDYMAAVLVVAARAVSFLTR